MKSEVGSGNSERPIIMSGGNPKPSPSVVADDSSSASGASSHDDIIVRDTIKKHWHLTDEQAAIIHKWAADDRLWTTQETVEFNLQIVARELMAIPASPDATEEWAAADIDGINGQVTCEGELLLCWVPLADCNRVAEVHNAAVAKLRKQIALLTDERDIWKRRAERLKSARPTDVSR